MPFLPLPPRWRKVLRDLWLRKMRTLLVVVAIAVSVFAAGMVSSAYAILSVDVNAAYAAILPAQIVLVTTDLDPELLPVLARTPGVERIEGRTQLQWLNFTTPQGE